MNEEEMYYKRVISDRLKNLLMIGGELHWLFKLVKERKDLDFLIGANNSHEWISVYCGTTRFLKITLKKNQVSISADPKYRNYAKQKGLKIYGVKETTELNFEKDFVQLISYLHEDSQLHRHFNNQKEGYFQNLFSRQFGIDGTGNEYFVMIDKEVVIGHRDMLTKNKYFGSQRDKFKTIKKYLSGLNPKRYGSKLTDDALGNEVDFLAVNRNGEILLIEFKHGSNTKGIYLAPIQIGLYCSLFQDYIRLHGQDFINNISDMMRQKKELGLTSPDFPEVKLSGKIVPVLIIAKYKPRSSALKTFCSVLQICREKLKDNAFLSELKVYEYDELKKLTVLT